MENMVWRPFLVDRFDSSKSGILMVSNDVLTGYAFYIKYPRNPLDFTCKLALDKVEDGIWTNLGDVEIQFDFILLHKIWERWLQAIQIGLEPVDAFLETIKDGIQP